MGLISFGGKMFIYGLALCGAAGIFGVGYYGIKAATSEPVSIHETVHNQTPVRENITDKIKQEAVKEVIGDESYRRIIRTEVKAALENYVRNERYIDELRKSEHFQPNYKNWIKKE